MTEGVPKVYLDTNIFQPLIYNSDSLADAQFAQSILESLRGQLSDEGVEVVIPKPAVGELVSNFREDFIKRGVAEVGSWDEFSNELDWYLDQVDAELRDVSRDAVSIADDLLSRDGRLDGTDAIIAACALEDRWSNYLVTEDGDFHETDAIQAIDEERQPTPRIYSLNITDRY